MYGSEHKPYPAAARSLPVLEDLSRMFHAMPYVTDSKWDSLQLAAVRGPGSSLLGESSWKFGLSGSGPSAVRLPRIGLPEIQVPAVKFLAWEIRRPFRPQILLAATASRPNKQTLVGPTQATRSQNSTRPQVPVPLRPLDLQTEPEPPRVPTRKPPSPGPPGSQQQLNRCRCAFSRTIQTHEHGPLNETQMPNQAPALSSELRTHHVERERKS